MEYPKINSLYKRQFTETDPVTGEIRYLDKGKSGNPLIIGEYACEEFSSISKWTVTEKVDGTNIRIIFERTTDGQGQLLLDANGQSACRVSYLGRTNNASIPTFLFRYLQDTFTVEKLHKAFPEANYVILFGEGYGSKIQLPEGEKKNPYRDSPSFCLFDVYCSGWWLKREQVENVAEKLGIELAPLIVKQNGDQKEHAWTVEEIENYVRSKPTSFLRADGREGEGIVARSEPQMMFRKGGPIMFKLKCKDFK